MPRAAHPPLSPAAGGMRVSPPEAGLPRRSQSLEARLFSLRGGQPPHPAPERAPGCPEVTAGLLREHHRRRLLEDLGARIARIEQRLPPAAGFAHRHGNEAPWTLGEEAVDSRIGPRGLLPFALHEIKPGTPGPAAAATASAFALRLALRRLAARNGAHAAPPRFLWCTTTADSGETGHLHGPGLAHLGLDPRIVLLVTVRKRDEVLWVLEEALRSAALTLVAGAVAGADLTAARRLSLAAEAGGTPGLLVTGARAPGLAATASRWRVGPAPSGAHPFDARAPGPPRFAVTLERVRNRPAEAEPSPATLEWCDEAYRFRLAAGLADRAPRPSYAQCRA